ncbi:thioredoxin fold domain-containing protein [Pedobacter sp. FW305-3-2-15-E-R2A2]|uniref:thioredoxin family protein n=1 Tax=Pedobacter sp. FW305-3-2-15-E-R2A2 TaxID=3140251 RepID=UPI003140B894
MKIYKICGLLLLIIASIRLSAQENQFVKTDSWEALFAKAKKENKLVFVDSYFVGCHPCKEMDDEVFPLPEVMKFMKDNFVSVKIDFMVEELGKALQLKYAVTGFPTFLILNEKGQLISRFSGYQEADVFQKLLRESILKSKKGEVLGGFSPSIQVAHPDFYTAMFKARQPMKAEALVAYLDQTKDASLEPAAIPFLVSRSLNKKWDDYFLVNYASFEDKYGKELIWGKRNAIMNARLKALGNARNDDRFNAFLTEIRPLFSDKDWAYAKMDMAEAYYYSIHKDHKTFFRYAAEHYNDDDNKIRYLSMYLNGPTVDAEEKELFVKWMEKVVNMDASYSVLAAATRLMVEQNDKEAAKKYAEWGSIKARLLKKDGAHFRNVL